MKLEEAGERKTSQSPYFFIKGKWTPVSHIPWITIELKFNQANVFRETASDHDEVFKFVFLISNQALWQNIGKKKLPKESYCAALLKRRIKK